MLSCKLKMHENQVSGSHNYSRIFMTCYGKDSPLPLYLRYLLTDLVYEISRESC
jgi:hypothetical protein